MEKKGEIGGGDFKSGCAKQRGSGGLSVPIRRAPLGMKVEFEKKKKAN